MYLIAMYTVFQNFKNSCGLFGIVSLCFLCMACPGEENCYDMGASALVDGLITLSPEQEVYGVGDELTLSLSLFSNNTYLGDEVDFYMETQDKLPLLVFHFEELFSENEVLINKGKKGDSSNRYNMVYNQEIGIYELIINITLEKNRSYAFLADASIYVIGREDCHRYRLDTSIVWQGIPWVEFRVEE